VALDEERLAPRLREGFAQLARPARNARFIVEGNRVRVAKGVLGRRIDTKAVARRLVEQPAAAEVAATFAAVRPDLTTREAQAMRIRELVSEYTTRYECCPPRVTNIKRAAEILDGTIIRAGERFSLNEALGERTVERGFLSAPQISQGRLVDAVGGGVSQMATTIFNAAFFAGLELVDHTPHQFYISRYPVGREATVSWGGPELIVRNDWGAAILMRTTATDTAVTVRLFSSRLGRRVTTTTGTPRGRRAARTIEVRNPALPPGSRVVAQDGGVEGFTVDYTRKVFQGDKLRRDERFTARYDPEDTIIEVGPPPPPPKAPTPQRPTPKPGAQPEPGTPPGSAETPPPPSTQPDAPPEQEVPGGTTAPA
jgi:vancomycin resistance protein YoaR